MGDAAERYAELDGERIASLTQAQAERERARELLAQGISESGPAIAHALLAISYELKTSRVERDMAFLTRDTTLIRGGR